MSILWIVVASILSVAILTAFIGFIMYQIGYDPVTRLKRLCHRRRFERENETVIAPRITVVPRKWAGWSQESGDNTNEASTQGATLATNLSPTQVVTDIKSGSLRQTGPSFYGV